MKKILRSLLIGFTAVLMTACGSGSSSGDTEKEKTAETFLTAAETAKDMGLGWNLGNTMEAYDANGCE